MKRVNFCIVILCILLALTCCGKGDTVLSIGGEDISYDMYRYFYMNYSGESSNYTKEQIQQKSIQAISLDVAISKLAEEYDISLSSTEEDSVDSYVEASVANYGGEDAYLEALEKNYLTEELFEYFYSRQLLESKLREYMYNEINNIIKSDDATFEKDLRENFMAAKQILIRNDEGDDVNENKELAETILGRLLNGEDFDTLISEYSEDTSAKENYVYHFTHGQMLSAFEEAVEKTPVNELCSHVVASEAGYHIIMRLPLDEEYVNKNYEDLRTAYKARCFNDIRQELADSFAIEESEGFDELKFDE